FQGYFGYADICDSTACQAYPGTANENALTDTAVTDTASVVVLMPGGAPAFTQYSSSTGGYTAPGTFAAVVDDGDSVCLQNACNSHHSWQVQIPVSSVQSTFPQIGTLVSITVTQRNGLGDFGGRAQQVSISGTNGSTTVTGNTFAADFGLQSNWFNIASQPSGGVGGYWVVGSDGGIFSFGTANYYGSMGNTRLVKPIVGMTATPDAGGYYMVAADGGIFAFGDAKFAGSMGGKYLAQPMVGMAIDPANGGYWTDAADGGIFSYGGAPFFGSVPQYAHVTNIVGMTTTPDGGGYWMVGNDGGIFSFGDAKFFGSVPQYAKVSNVTAMAATPDGKGYWVLGADGGVYSFGDAAFEGSLPGRGISATATDLLPTKTGAGYEILTADGQVVPFGDAPQFGQPSTYKPAATMVAGATVAG
ncbi:MAG TPA: hypothetical protein VE991_03020, partial [Acidimicrobiales bacterium]|nr:hypothetical protein [Acidimicrobiales bacterium]